MFLGESEYLLSEGVAGKTVIEAVDRFFHDNPSSRAVHDADSVAAHTDQDPADVGRVLAAYAAHKFLVVTDMVRCPNLDCEGLTPLSSVVAGQSDGDEVCCDGNCAQALPPISQLRVVETFKVRSSPLT